MQRRAFLLSTGGAAAGMLLLPRFAHAEAGRIDWYTPSDQNILDFWTNVVQPAFEAANPGVTLNLVDAGDNSGAIAIAERALAALSSSADPQADYFESYDPRLPSGAHRRRALRQHQGSRPLELCEDQPARHRHRLLGALPRQPGAARLRHRPSSTRRARRRPSPTSSPGSRRTPASSSTTAPTRAAPAATSSAAPSTRRTATTRAKFTVDNFTAEAAEAALTPAWDILQDLAPSLFDEGAYTSGNTQSIQLLSQSAVTMIPAWSDQAIQAITTRACCPRPPASSSSPTSACPAASRAASCSRTASTRTRRSSSPTSS